MTMENLLTARDLAERLRITTDTVYRMARQGRIPAVRVGRTWRFRETAIEGWLGSHEPARRPSGDDGRKSRPFGTYNAGPFLSDLRRETIYGG